MVIFRYEWRRNRRYILVWSAVLAICIFAMTPVYYGMIATAGAALSPDFAQGGFFETVGVSMELLEAPLGMYAFLTGFFMIAGGIFGMHLGLSLYTRECTENTAEYLFTKPCGRREIYRGKALCLLGGVGTAGAAYLLASLASMTLFRPGFPAGEFLLVALSFALLTLFFGGLGLLMGTCKPNSRSPLLTAGLTVFLTYCVTSFSRTVGNRAVSFLSPFSFFSPAKIHELGRYEGDYFLWYLLLTASFFLLARQTLLRRDIKFEA